LRQSDPRLPMMRIAQADLEEALVLRRAIWDAANAVRESRCPAPSDISAINRFAAYLPPVPALDADGSRAVLTLPEGPRSALSVVARDAVDVLTRHSDMPIKQCENPACALLFVDTSRGKQRRWCSMGRCGNMKKVARHRAKSGAQGANVAAGGDVE
jgi:predicted RNA-binding Zn ribbon-like protein